MQCSTFFLEHLFFALAHTECVYAHPNPFFSYPFAYTIQMSVQTVRDIDSKQCVNEEALLHLCQLSVGNNLKLHNVLWTQLKLMMEKPVMILLTLNDSVLSCNLSLTQLFDDSNLKDTPEVCMVSKIIVMKIKV